MRTTILFDRLTGSSVRRSDSTKHIAVRAIVVLLFGTLLPGTSNATPIFFSGTGHWYDRIDGIINYDAAKIAAASSTFLGSAGHLVTITSAAENSFILSNLGGDGYLIGAEQVPDSATPSSGWTWITGEAWDFTAWNSNEPNDGTLFNTVENNVENHVRFYRVGSEFGWNDISDGGFGYIVEYSISSTAPEPASLALLGLVGVPFVARRRKA